jgi:hypothetical protein
MATRLTLGQILSDMRDAGWSTAQIQERTGVSRQTQWAIRTGRTSGKTYSTAIRQARRTGVRPPPKRITPVPAAKSKVWGILADLRETGVTSADTHSDADIEQLIEDIGDRPAERLLREQLESTRRFIDGHMQPGNKRWWNREERWNKLTRRNEEVSFDDERDSYFYYHGKKA